MIRLLLYRFSHLHVLSCIEYGEACRASSEMPIIAIYAVPKISQWSWPETNGEDKFIIMMGGLLIEINLVKLIGCSGVIDRRSGASNPMLAGSHVTRTRYAHQVTAAALCILQNPAYQLYLVEIMPFRLENSRIGN